MTKHTDIRKRKRHGSRRKEVTMVTGEVKPEREGVEQRSEVECVATDGEGGDGKERRGENVGKKERKRYGYEGPQPTPKNYNTVILCLSPKWLKGIGQI